MALPHSRDRPCTGVESVGVNNPLLSPDYGLSGPAQDCSVGASVVDALNLTYYQI